MAASNKGKNDVMSDSYNPNHSNASSNVRNAITSNGGPTSQESPHTPWNGDQGQTVVPHLSSSFVSKGNLESHAPQLPDTSKPPPNLALGVADTSQPPPSMGAPVVMGTDVSLPPPVDVTKPPPAVAEPEKSEAEVQWNTLHEYWTFVQENPYDFEGWGRLLGHVENMEDITTARSAFEGFLPLFPYCFAYWRKFAELELKATGREMCLGILLYGMKAIPMCQELWIPLLKYFIKYVKENNLDPQLVRGMYAMGLERIGFSWHSSPFWELCIGHEVENGDLEQALALYCSIIRIPNKVYNKHWDKLIALVRDNKLQDFLSKEQFAKLELECTKELASNIQDKTILLPENKDKLQEKLETSMKESLVEDLIKVHEQTVERSDKRWKFEEKLKRPYFHVKALDKKQIKLWNEYLDYEIGEGDPVRIVMLFERCLITCAQYEDFWCRYAEYLEQHIANVSRGKYRDMEYMPGCFSSPKEETPTLPYQRLMDLNVAPKTKGQLEDVLRRLSQGVGVGERVLMCPPLSHQWVLRDISIEDLRQVFRRAAWIHCPSKPKLLMQWAEFEEGQGDIQTARELLNTVIAKHPMLLESRLQLIELERRAGMLDIAETYYANAFSLMKEPRWRSLVAIKFARFLFKIRGQTEQPLIVLRKALKKDKGNIHLYQHVFDICYQRQPVDTNGVLAAVMLAMSSKELSLEQKHQLCLKRQYFLKEHGTIAQIKEAKAETLQLEKLLATHHQPQPNKPRDEDEQPLKYLEEKEEILRKALEKVEAQERKSGKKSKRTEALEEGEQEDDDDEEDEDDILWRRSSRHSEEGSRRKDSDRKSSRKRRHGRDRSPRRSRRSKRRHQDENPRHDLQSHENGERHNGNMIPLSEIGNFQPPMAMRQGVLGDSSFNAEKGSNVGVLQMREPPPAPLPIIPNFNEAPPPIRPFNVRPPFSGPIRPSGLPLEGPPIIAPGNMRMPPPPGVPPPNFPTHMNAPPGLEENKRMRFNGPGTSMPQRMEQQMRNPLLAFNAPTHSERPPFRMPPPTATGGPALVNVPEWLVKEGGELKLSDGPQGASVVRYWPRFVTDNGHDTLLGALRKTIKWLPQKIQTNTGAWLDMQMLGSWLGPCDYQRNALTLPANTHWPPEMVDLLHVLARACNLESPFNSCLMRLFRHGMDHLPWDTEQHPAISNDSTMALITIGSPRVIEMRRKSGPEYLKFPLLPGSLLITEGRVHTDWLYQIPKSGSGQGESICLSFRTMLMIQGLTV